MLDIVFGQSAHASLSAALPADNCQVYNLDLCWSVGDLSADALAQTRRAALCELCQPEITLPETTEWIDASIENAAASLETILQRSAAGEPVRIWYSSTPDEMCGFYWTLAQLDSLQERCSPISMVSLPLFLWQQRDGIAVHWRGWGEVAPREWRELVTLEQPVPPSVRSAAAVRWRILQRENAPLRAVVNGILLSVPADFYDGFIRREIAAEPEEFSEAYVIGNTLGRNQLAISDSWVANRIDLMIQAGELEAVTQASEGGPSYRRILRKLRPYRNSPITTGVT